MIAKLSSDLGTKTDKLKSVSTVRPWLEPVLAFSLPFVVYGRTLAPTIYGLDSAELTNAAYSLGLAHAPGYPLYLLLGHVFTWLPIGDVGYRMNLMSAFFGAATVALCQQIVFKLTGRRLLALAGALFLAYSFYFWSASVMAEVYTLQSCLTAGLLLTLLSYQNGPHPRRLYLLALIFGLSLSNHLMALLLGPGLLYGLGVAAPRRPHIREVAIMAILVCLGLSLYLYLPLRSVGHPATRGIMDIRIESAADFLTVWSGQPFWPFVFAYKGIAFWQQAVAYLYALWGNFLSFGFVLGLLGVVVTFRHDQKLTITLLGLFLVNAIFFIGYGAVDKALMFIPTYFIWAIWLTFGLKWLVEQAQSFNQAGTFRHINLAAICLILPVVALSINFSNVDLSRDRRSYERAGQIIEAVEPAAHLLVTTWPDLGPLQYLQIVEGRRPDVTIVNASQLSPAELQSLIDQQRTKGPTYLTSRRDEPGQRQPLTYLATCRCYQVP